MAALMTPGLEMIADRGAVHTVSFGGHRQFDELTRGELFSRRLVSQFEFSHGFFSTPRVRHPGHRHKIPGYGSRAQ